MTQDRDGPTGGIETREAGDPRPPIRSGARWFAHHEQPAVAQDPARGARGRRWGSETSGHDGIGRGGQGEVEGIRRLHGHSSHQVEPAHQPHEVVGAGPPAVDEDELQIGTSGRDDEAGYATAAAEVHDQTPHIGQGRDERPRMLDDLADRPVTEHAESL